MDQTVFYPGYGAWAAENPRADAMLRAPAAFDMGYEGTRGARAAQAAAFQSKFLGGTFGSALKIGTAESFGWHLAWNKGRTEIINHGFLGWKKLGEESVRIGKSWGGGLFRPSFTQEVGSKIFHGPSKLTGGQIARIATHTAPVRGLARAAFNTGMRALPLIMTAYMAYEGYKEEGVWGAAKGIGESVAWSVGLSYAGSILAAAAPVLIATAPLAIGAAGLVGYTALGRAGVERLKDYRQTEMGGSSQDLATIGSAGAATMRQRSLAALNNTHLNGRMALGNEAFLMHRSFGT